MGLLNKALYNMLNSLKDDLFNDEVLSIHNYSAE
jgi:hypothetical protein